MSRRAMENYTEEGESGTQGGVRRQHRAKERYVRIQRRGSGLGGGGREHNTAVHKTKLV